MVVDLRDEQRADLVFAALADATRRDIVRRVCREPLSVSQLASAYPMSFAAVQKHVAVLERAQVVTKARRGREQLVRGEVATLHAAAGLIAQYEAIWRERLDRFEQVLLQSPEGIAP